MNVEGTAFGGNELENFGKMHGVVVFDSHLSSDENKDGFVYNGRLHIHRANFMLQTTETL